MEYFLLCSIWALWCFLHSFLITTRTTTWFKKHLKDRFTFYRISYNIFSILTVIPLLLWQEAIPGPVILKLSPFLLIFKYIVLILSVAIIAGSFLSFDVPEFAGIKQITDRKKKEDGRGTHEKDKKIKDEGGETRDDGRKTMDEEKSQTEQTPVISKHGFYALVRHPMYLGGAIYFTASMMNASLARVLGYFILTIYMIIGTVREDRRLTRELGDAYRNYQKEVPMFIPKVTGKED